VLAVQDGPAMVAAAHAEGIPATLIGHSGGGDLILPDGDTISLATLRASHEYFFPAWFAAR
jgi:phosphoribosylformylglycinamidine synthase